MSYLIDGHNLIPKIPGLDLRNVDDEIALIQLLQGFCQRTQKQVDVYFDNAQAGNVGKRKYGAVTAHFVRAGTTADSAIQSRLSSLGRAARNWIVVSSDRQVQAEARGSGAKIIPSESFAADLFKTASPPKTGKPKQDVKLSQAEIEEWLNLFGDEHNHNHAL